MSYEYIRVCVCECALVECTLVQLNFSLPEPNRGRTCLINVLVLLSLGIQIYVIPILVLMIFHRRYFVRTEIIIITYYKYTS